MHSFVRVTINICTIKHHALTHINFNLMFFLLTFVSRHAMPSLFAILIHVLTDAKSRRAPRL